MPQPSLDRSDVLNLLIPEERTTLKANAAFLNLSAGSLIREVLKLRLPFVRMMSDVASLLGEIESAVRGNVRFIVLPDGDLAALRFNFGPQLRGAIAKALNDKLLVDYHQVLKERTEQLERTLSRLCDRIRPRLVDRYTYLGRSVDAATAYSKMGTSQAYLLRKQTSKEINSAEWHDLASVDNRLDHLKQLVSKLTDVAHSHAGVELEKILARASTRIKMTLSSGRSSIGWPPPARCTEEADSTHGVICIDAVIEAVLAASDFSESLTDLYDFFNLDIWKQRWRLYELWVLARLILFLLGCGAAIAGSERITAGEWRLKFTRDSGSVLSLKLDGETIDLYYQFYQPRRGTGDGGTGEVADLATRLHDGEFIAVTGDMPDLAMRLHGGAFIAVVDPKHGKSYSRRNLNDVCQRYANAFDPQLSCVCNYFAVRQTEEIGTAQRMLVLYNLQPNTDAVVVFEKALHDALGRTWNDLGRSLPSPPSIVVLFDGSASAEHRRAALLDCFKSLESEFRPRPGPDSGVLIFGEDIMREGGLTELTSGRLLEGLPSAGTDFQKAVRAALKQLDRLPPPKHLWIFTDGEGLGDPLGLKEELSNAGTQIRIVEAGHSNLEEISKFIRAQHLRL